MEVTTLETEGARRAGGRELRGRDRLGAWLYTGAPGRALSFSLDVALTLAAIALWSGRRAWASLRDALRRTP